MQQLRNVVVCRFQQALACCVRIGQLAFSGGAMACVHLGLCGAGRRASLLCACIIIMPANVGRWLIACSQQSCTMQPSCEVWSRLHKAYAAWGLLVQLLV